jgi:hypothetical protein
LGAENDLWKPVAAGAAPKAAAAAAADGAAATNDYEFSIIELHLNSKGQGEGKISLTGKLAFDSTGKVIALENYGALPVVLKDVARRSLGKS